MPERGINVKPKRRKVKTTDSKHNNPMAPHLLKRDFSADAPNTKWVADITGIETAQGWLYLAVVLDLYSRLVVGWAMSKERDEQLVTKALDLANPFQKIGLTSIAACRVSFESCRVPVAQWLGQEGQGSQIGARSLIFLQITGE